MFSADAAQSAARRALAQTVHTVETQTLFPKECWWLMSFSQPELFLSPICDGKPSLGMVGCTGCVNDD